MKKKKVVKKKKSDFLESLFMALGLVIVVLVIAAGVALGIEIQSLHAKAADQGWTIIQPAYQPIVVTTTTVMGNCVLGVFSDGFTIKQDVLLDNNDHIQGITAPGERWIEIKAGLSAYDFANTVAHEASHATDAIIKTHGLGTNTEVRAYIEGYLTECITRLLTKK